MLGNGRVEVKCLDQKDRQCVIRQKFRGRGKRDNTIAMGSWILVGIREWETSKEGKMDTCELPRASPIGICLHKIMDSSQNRARALILFKIVKIPR